MADRPTPRTGRSPWRRWHRIGGVRVTVRPWEAGTSFLSDLADTDADLLGGAGYAKRVGGWSAYAVAGWGAFQVSGEDGNALDTRDMVTAQLAVEF